MKPAPRLLTFIRTCYCLCRPCAEGGHCNARFCFQETDAERRRQARAYGRIVERPARRP